MFQLIIDTLGTLLRMAPALERLKTSPEALLMIVHSSLLTSTAGYTDATTAAELFQIARALLEAVNVYPNKETYNALVTEIKSQPRDTTANRAAEFLRKIGISEDKIQQALSEVNRTVGMQEGKSSIFPFSMN